MRDTLTPFLSQAESPNAGRLRRPLLVGLFVALVTLALIVPPAAVGSSTAVEDWPWDVQPGADSDVFPLVGEITFRDENGERAGASDAWDPIGVDPGLNVAVFTGEDTLRLVDTRTLEQLDVIDLPTEEVTDGGFSTSTAVLDTDNHRVFFEATVPGPRPGEEEVADAASSSPAGQEYRYCGDGYSSFDVLSGGDPVDNPPTLRSVPLTGNTACDNLRRGEDLAIVTVSLTGEHDPVVAPLDLAAALAPEEAAMNTKIPLKLAYHAPTDRVYAMTESEGEAVVSDKGTGNVEYYNTLHELRAADLADPGPDGVAPVWSYQLETCYQAAPSASKGGFLARSLRADFVYLPCWGHTLGPFESGANPVGMHGVTRIDLNEGPDGSPDPTRFEERFHPIAADVTNGDVGGDAARDLVFFTGQGASSPRMWTFDAHQEAWTGATSVASFGPDAPVSDPETGRVYQWSSYSLRGEFRVTEADRLAVPQGEDYDLGFMGGTSHDFPLWGIFDPSTRRLFFGNPEMCLEWADEGSCAVEEPSDERPHVRVFADRLPVASPPEPVDWDAATEDVTDGPVFTSASANGAAYGARYLFAGGTRNNRVTNAVPGDSATLNNAVDSAPVGPANREVVRARVTEAGLSRVTSTPEVWAAARGLVVGGQTKSDVNRNSDAACGPSRTVNYPSAVNPGLPFVPVPCLPDDWQRDDPDGGDSEVEGELTPRERDLYGRWRGSSWPEEFPERMRGDQAYCDDFGGSPSDDAAPGAAVSCDAEDPVAQAGALYTASDEQAPVQVGYAETSVESYEDEQLGAVATATAVARDIDLFGQVSIGEVRTVATAVAHGRSGTAATELTREYRQVRVGDGFACGWGDDDPCDVWEVARAITDATQPRLVASVPAADTSLNPDAGDEPDDRTGVARVSNGTPGGAKATVTLDRYDARSNKVINEDTRTELPGLQIVFYDDDDTTSRHIFQFAAVDLDVNFTVNAAPTFDPPDWGNGGGGFGGGDGFGDGSGGGLPGDVGGAATRAVQPPSITALGEEPVSPAEELELDSGGSAPPTGDAGGFEADDGTSGLEQGQAPSLGTAEGPALDAGRDVPAPEVASDTPSGDQTVVAQGEQGGSSGPGGLVLTRQRMGESVPLAVLWVLAALPFYLAVRRRRLLTSSAR